MFSAVFLGLFALVGALLTFVTAAIVGFYLSPVPGGSNAAGLVIPFFAGILAGLAGIIAGSLTVSRGSLDWLGFSRATALALMVGVAVLVGVAIVGSFLAWADKQRLAQPGLLLFSGLLLPLGFFAFQLALLWQPTTVGGPAFWVRGLGVLTGAAALMGLVTAGLLVQAIAARSARAQAYRQEAQAEEQKEEDRLQALSPEQRLLEDLSKMGDTAPLWSLTAGLPTEKSPSLRALWIERALRVPDLDAEMGRTLTGKYGSYRHGCAVMLGEMPEAALRPAAWTPLLAQDAKLTAEDIRKFGDLASHEDDNLGLHVAAIARAAVRFPPNDELREALTGLRAAVAAMGATTDRAKLVSALDAAIVRPSGGGAPR